MRLPEGAMPILQARKNGLKPANDVVIVAKQGIVVRNYTPVVRAQIKQQYDWIFMKDLKGFIICESTMPYQIVFKEISLYSGKEFLQYWFTDKEQGGYVTCLPTVETFENPSHKVDYELDLVPNSEKIDLAWKEWIKEITACN